MTDMALPLAGRAALITGANRGLGQEIARAYLHAGADVYLCARDAHLMHQVAEELRSLYPARRIAWSRADAGRTEYVERMVRDALTAFPNLCILVNNAGVYGPMGALEEIDWNQWIEAIAINLIGSAFVIRTLLPHFKACNYGKIIQLSGGGATNPLPRVSAYAASKAGIVRLVETIAEECKQYHIDANSIAPGALNTRMLDEVLEAGPLRVGTDFYNRALRQKESGGAGLARGAELSVFLGAAASDGITGRLISAVWDRWEEWPKHTEELAASDLYTLRRITGRDRGTSWGDK